MAKTLIEGKVEIQIPFWGFYESIHDSNIDQAVDDAFNYDYETGEEIELDYKFYDAKFMADIDWSAIHKGYAKAYTEAFGERFDLDLEFVELTSPREYNFSTDRIFAKVPIEQINKIRKEVEAHEKYPEYIKERFTSYDGFISFYSNDYNGEEWTREVLDECQYGVILDFYLEKVYQDENWQAFLMDDFRGNGGMDGLVNDAVEAIKVYQKEVKIKDAVNDINKAIGWIDNEYLWEYNMPTYAYEAVQEMKSAVKKLEGLYEV